jgi:hypothetical protein
MEQLRPQIAALDNNICRMLEMMDQRIAEIRCEIYDKTKMIEYYLTNVINQQTYSEHTANTLVQFLPISDLVQICIEYGIELNMYFAFDGHGNLKLCRAIDLPSAEIHMKTKHFFDTIGLPKVRIIPHIANKDQFLELIESTISNKK